MVAVMGQRHLAGRFGIISACAHSFGGDSIACWLVLYTQGTYVVLVHVVEVAGPGGLRHGVRKHRGRRGRRRDGIDVERDGSGGWAGASPLLVLVLVMMVVGVHAASAAWPCVGWGCESIDRMNETSRRASEGIS